MQANEQKADVIVVGGGVAGLAAAALVARQGKRVRVVEQSRDLGGRARTKIQDGFHLNLGPHALYRAGRGMEVLKELGVTPRGRVPSVSGAFAIRRGEKHTFPAGFVSMLTTSLFPLSAKLEAMRLLSSIGKIDTEPLMRVSVSEWLDKQITHAEVREFLLATFRVTTYTNAPDLMSAGAAIEQLQMAFDKSVLYLDHGWQTIVDGLAEAAAREGVRIETGSRVESVERDGAGAVSAARLADGRRLEAPVIVLASSPSVAARLVERGGETELARWADEAMPVRAACLDVALKYLPVPKATFALGIDRPLYLSVHSATADLGPEGAAMIHVAKYLPPGESLPPEEVEGELERLLDTVQAGWREALVYRRFLPDMIVMNDVATARNGGTRGRPGPQVEGAPGLFVVGDWVGAEGMLVDASLASAKRAAEMIAAREQAALAVAV